MPIVVNLTEQDITLTFNSVAYTFPGNPKPKEGEKPRALRGIDVGNPGVADWFILKAQLPIDRKVKRLTPVDRLQAVVAPPEKEAIEIVGTLFQVAKPPAQKIVSAHSGRERDPITEPGPQPKPEKLDIIRKAAISRMPWTLLMQECVRRGLAKKGENLKKPVMVDMLFDKGFDPQ